MGAESVTAMVTPASPAQDLAISPKRSSQDSSTSGHGTRVVTKSSGVKAWVVYGGQRCGCQVLLLIQLKRFIGVNVYAFCVPLQFEDL